MKTKLLFSLIGVLLAGTTLSAQTSVWKITKERRTVYLGGTCPVLRATDYPLPKEFDLAFAAAPQICFETDLARLQSPEVQQTIASRALAADGNTLNKTLSADSWKNVQEFCGMAGIPEESMSKVQAWRCRAMLTSVEMQKQGVSPKRMDSQFYLRTVGSQKTVTNLDTVEQHIDYLTRPGTGHESEMIEYTLKEISGLSQTQEELIKAWKVGDLTKIDALVLQDLRRDHPALYSELITQRSSAWLPKIESLFQTSKTKFVLVDVGNLAGPEGLLAQLRQRGYTVEQLKSTDARL